MRGLPGWSRPAALISKGPRGGFFAPSGRSPSVPAAETDGEWADVHSITMVVMNCNTGTEPTSWSALNSLYRQAGLAHAGFRFSSSIGLWLWEEESQVPGRFSGLSTAPSCRQPTTAEPVTACRL